MSNKPKIEMAYDTTDYLSADIQCAGYNAWVHRPSPGARYYISVMSVDIRDKYTPDERTTHSVLEVGQYSFGSDDAAVAYAALRTGLYVAQELRLLAAEVSAMVAETDPDNLINIVDVDAGQNENAQ